MPTYFVIDGIKIDLYFDDHAPPHFHALFAEYEVLIAIKTLDVHQGSLPKKQLKKIIQWARKNQDLLLEIWQINQSKG
jgi:hypothetical protein